MLDTEACEVWSGVEIGEYGGGVGGDGHDFGNGMDIEECEVGRDE